VFILCTVFRLIVVLFCVMCVVCVLCLIVVPLPPGENPFAVKINNFILGWNYIHAGRIEPTGWLNGAPLTGSPIGPGLPY
jgi:hypothetical protein